MPGKDVTTMNRVILMGKLTKNPEIKYAGKDNDMAVARYTLAVNRRYKRDGEQEADFISCVTFGKSAEFAQKYLHKGMRIVIGGRISTGSYKDKDGKTIYTTDVIVEEHEFAQNKDSGAGADSLETAKTDKDGFMEAKDGEIPLPIRPFTEEGSWSNKQRREYVLDEDGNQIKDAKGKDIFNAVSTTGWNDPELLKEWRRAWTEKVNEKFRECHMAARIDHRSYKEQGIDLIPTIHEGYEVRAMEKKGIKTVIGELNRAIRQFNQMFISLKESIQWMKTAYEEMKAELDRRQNPTLLESLQDYYDKKTQGRPLLPNFYAEMKRRGKNLSNLQEFAKSINYLQIHKIETMEDLQERIDELNGVVSVSKKEISEKRDQLKKLENLEKMVEVIKTNQPLIDEYNHFFFQKKRDKYYQQHKKEINYYRKCERELKQHLDKNGKVPTARWKREKEELRTTIEELKADNQPYQDELAFVKKVQSCADIARCDREMAETDTSGSSEEKREKQVKFPAFHAAQTEVNLEEKSKVEQQTVNQTEQKPEKKNSIRKQLAEKKKECEERDAKQQTVRKKRNYDMSL